MVWSESGRQGLDIGAITRSMSGLHRGFDEGHTELVVIFGSMALRYAPVPMKLALHFTLASYRTSQHFLRLSECRPSRQYKRSACAPTQKQPSKHHLYQLHMLGPDAFQFLCLASASDCHEESY